MESWPGHLVQQPEETTMLWLKRDKYGEVRKSQYEK